jgi:UDP:flavonoid glycosyltransferase YjiC (YdhE family)
MKIASFSENVYPELSGISDSIIALARELAGRGHEIHFFVPRYGLPVEVAVLAFRFQSFTR